MRRAPNLAVTTTSIRNMSSSRIKTTCQGTSDGAMCAHAVEQLDFRLCSTAPQNTHCASSKDFLHDLYEEHDITHPQNENRVDRGTQCPHPCPRQVTKYLITSILTDLQMAIGNAKHRTHGSNAQSPGRTASHTITGSRPRSSTHTISIC